MKDSKNFIYQKRARSKKKDKKEEAMQAALNGTPVYSPAPREITFNFDTVHGMKLTEMDYYVPPLEERKQRRREFDGDRENGVEGMRSKFLKMLVSTQEKVLVERLGLTQTDLDGMRKGFTPNGFNVHHKLPLHGGGKNEFSNFILTPLYPHDQWHKDIIEKQAEGIATYKVRKILIPWTDDMIYDPKTYGFYKDNEKVEKPNYTSKVSPTNYSKNWLPEQISVEKRQAEMKDVYAQFAEKDKERQKDAIKTISSVIQSKRQR